MYFHLFEISYDRYYLKVKTDAGVLLNLNLKFPLEYYHVGVMDFWKKKREARYIFASSSTTAVDAPYPPPWQVSQS
jgi:hypothetical protein